MSNALEYILSLNDQMTTKLQKIGVSSDNALNKFSKLQKQSNDTKKLLNDMGGSVGSLRAKLDLLRSEKEWIPASNLQSIRKYNTEIKNLEKEIQHLDTINGSVFKRNMKDAISNLPFSNLITNPVVAVGAGIFAAGKAAMGFEEGMAKINTTAQLSQPKLKELQNTLRGMGKEYGADLNAIPEAYEKILSQTGDATLSTEILREALKGSVGGFTDQTIVADALAQSLSLIGKENTNAKEVLDTFFAAKRVGAGEFKDFAQYMPGLIASGKTLGIEFKQTAGMFAYMTGKGQSAERSATLMENAFSALNKIDIRDNLKTEGIKVFDESGTIRSMDAIFGDLSKKMKGMSDEQKSSFLAKVGLTDKEARSAFIIMTEDNKKLSESLKEVSNAQGEADKAFETAQTNMQKIRKMFSTVQDLAISLGGVLAVVLTPALDVLSWTVNAGVGVLTWFFDGISNGNPWIIALAASVASLTIAWNYSAISMKLQNMWLNILIVKETILNGVKKASAFVTGLVTTATMLWNAALLANPIGLVIIAIVALSAAVYACVKAFDFSTASQKAHKEVTEQVNSAMASETAQLSLLFTQLRATNPGTKERVDLVEQLKQKYPGLIEQYGLEEAKLKDINKAQQDIIKSVRQRITADIKMKQAEKILTEVEEMKSDNDYFKYFGKTDKWNQIKEKQKAADELIREASGLPKKGEKPKESANEIITKGKGKVDEVIKNPLNTETLIQEEIKKLSEDKQNFVIGSDDYNSTQNKIEELQKKLNPNKSRGGSGSSVGSRTNESIASGGAKQTTINMTFKDIIGQLTVTGKDFKEAKANLETQVTDAVVRTLNMATSTAG